MDHRMEPISIKYTSEFDKVDLHEKKVMHYIATFVGLTRVTWMVVGRLKINFQEKRQALINKTRRTWNRIYSSRIIRNIIYFLETMGDETFSSLDRRKVTFFYIGLFATFKFICPSRDKESCIFDVIFYNHRVSRGKVG